MSRNLSNKIKRKIVGKQKYKCNNRPKEELRNLKGFECPLWDGGEDQGIFDENGYEIDHIIEYSLTQDNSSDNLQALCIVCHREKTNRFMRSKKISDERDTKSIIIPNENCKLRVKKKIRNNAHECNNCGKIFSSNSSLQYHIINKVCYVCKRHCCNKCSKKFSHRSSLSRHMRDCKGEITITDVCTNNESVNMIIERLSRLEKELTILKEEKVIKIPKHDTSKDKQTINAITKTAGMPGTKRKPVRRMRSPHRSM